VCGSLRDRLAQDLSLLAGLAKRARTGRIRKPIATPAALRATTNPPIVPTGFSGAPSTRTDRP
jgi:hypothetical protein